MIFLLEFICLFYIFSDYKCFFIIDIYCYCLWEKDMFLSRVFFCFVFLFLMLKHVQFVLLELSQNLFKIC